MASVKNISARLMIPCSAMRARRVDHEVDDFLADATVLQIDDLSCRQVIQRLGIADVPAEPVLVKLIG